VVTQRFRGLPLSVCLSEGGRKEGRKEGRKDSGDENLAADSCVIFFSVEISTWKCESFEGVVNRGFRERICNLGR